MNAILPQSDRFGRLEVFEVFDYFDGPKLFACRNAAGQIFLAMWVGTQSASETYWLVALSGDRFSMVRSGGINLARAFLIPETGFIYEYVIQPGQPLDRVQVLLPEQLERELIPDADEFISLQTETLATRFLGIGLPNKAVAVQRELVGLHFNFPGTREEAPTKQLGRILVSIQETLDALGQMVTGNATLRGVILPEILFQTETRLVQAAGGSFAVEITTAQPLDLFQTSVVTDAISQLVDILEVGNEVEGLRAKLIEIQPRAASKYRQFLSYLIGAQTPLRLEWASPVSARNRTVELTLAVAAGALQTAEQVTKEIGQRRTGVGFFVGVELPRRTFTAVLEDDENVYRGKIEDAAMPAADHVTLNLPYRITIRETLEITSSGEERIKYSLELIEPV